jgi:hypothetical protein
MQFKPPGYIFAVKKFNRQIADSDGGYYAIDNQSTIRLKYRPVAFRLPIPREPDIY